MEKKYFFGWTNIKWVIREFANMYSNKDSYFSKKRFESSIAFLSGVGIILSFVYSHRQTITNSEVLADAVILFGLAGYQLNAIQKEKKENPLPSDNSDIKTATDSIKKEESAPIIDADSLKKSEDSI